MMHSTSTPLANRAGSGYVRDACVTGGQKSVGESGGGRDMLTMNEYIVCYEGP